MSFCLSRLVRQVVQGVPKLNAIRLFENKVHFTNNFNLVRLLRTHSGNKNLQQFSHQEVVQDETKIEKEITDKVVNEVNNQILDKSHSRLFAVIQLCGKQYKITNEDIIVIEGTWVPNVGDEIRLEKVLLVGSNDFTLIGRPLLPLDLVTINGIIIEKTLGHTKTRFRKIKRKQYMRINFNRFPLTYVRITNVLVKPNVNVRSDSDGLEDRIL